MEEKLGYNSRAMEMDGSYESKLLRIVIGFLHVSLSEQLAQSLHGKSFAALTQEQKEGMQTEMVNNVMTVARQVGEAMAKEFLQPPPPPGPIH